MARTPGNSPSAQKTTVVPVKLCVCGGGVHSDGSVERMSAVNIIEVFFKDGKLLEFPQDPWQVEVHVCHVKRKETVGKGFLGSLRLQGFAMALGSCPWRHGHILACLFRQYFVTVGKESHTLYLPDVSLWRGGRGSRSEYLGTF